MTTTNDFKTIVLNETPLIDVRAPIEYVNGAFINSVNLPIMTDEERHLVGIKYKELGNIPATELGHSLVSGDIRLARTNAWLDYIKKNPKALLYCFRGGSRSKIAQEWIKDALGQDIIRLEGGYKAFRRYLIDAMSPEQQTAKPIILSGYTGSGKTILLKKLKNMVDLEGIAHHRGSSFGNFIDEQPSQINFENNLAYALIQHKHNNYAYVVLEDEGQNVGKRFLPKDLVAHYRTGDYVFIDVSLEERVQITLDEYVIKSQSNYIERFGEEVGLSRWHDYITLSMTKVKRRLGGDRFNVVIEHFESAYKEQLATHSFTPHESWLEIFLKEYYDPMYRYQLGKTNKKTVFSGNTTEVLEYLQSLE